MAGLTIYIDDKDLKKAQKGTEYKPKYSRYFDWENPEDVYSFGYNSIVNYLDERTPQEKGKVPDYNWDEKIDAAAKEYEKNYYKSINDRVTNLLSDNKKLMEFLDNFKNTKLINYKGDKIDFNEYNIETFANELYNTFKDDKKFKKTLETALGTEYFDANTLSDYFKDTDSFKKMGYDNGYTFYVPKTEVTKSIFPEWEAYIEKKYPELMRKYKEKFVDPIITKHFVEDYYNSEAYKNRLQKAGLSTKTTFRIPELRLDEDDLIGNSYHYNGVANIGVNDAEDFIEKLKMEGELEGKDNMPAMIRYFYDTPFSVGMVAAHELAHENPLYNTRSSSDTKPEDSSYYGNDYSKVPQRYKDILIGKDYEDTHDAELNENYSDLMGTRAALQLLNIFDSTDPNAVFTKEMLKKYRETNEGKIDRFLKYHTDEQIIDAINDVAVNDNNNYELDKAQYGIQTKINILDDVNEHKFRKLYDSDNKSWYTGFTGRRGENTNGEVYLANGMSNAEIRKEFPGALIKVENGVKTFRLPNVNEEVELPKVNNKWNTLVTLPNGQEERQMIALIPEKRTNYVDGYRTTKNGIQNMINFTDPWTLPKWTMAFENASGGPYSDRYYQLQNEYFDNGGKDNPLEYILNKDFDEVKTTGELETLNIPNALLYNTTKGTFMVSDENGNINYSDYNLTPNDHYSVTDNFKIYRPKKTTITTIDHNAVKRNKFINEMNDVNRLANMVNAGQNRTWNLQYQQGGPTHLQPWDEQRFRMWFNSLPEGIRNSNDYDYRGWWLENGSIPYKNGVHFTDKFKLQNHPTFSEESIYSKGNTEGGYWTKDGFVPSPYNTRNGSDRIIDYMEFGDKGSKMFDTNGMVAQFKDGGPTGLTILIDDEQFKKGGQIHIKEKNKGKFTKQAQSAGMSVQEFARHVLAHKDRYPASTVKRANFARNASKWGK